MITLTIDDTADPLWNKRLLSSKFGTIYQTKEYAQYVESELNQTALFLKFLNEKNEVVAQVVIFKSFRGSKKLTKIIRIRHLISIFEKFKPFPSFLHWNFGPVIFDQSKTSEILEQFGTFLKNQKAEFQGSTHPLTKNLTFSLDFNFKTNNLGTFIIDLRQSLDQILKDTEKKSVQKNIKRSQERGVTISQINSSQDLQIYYQILNQFRKENNLSTYSFNNIIKGFDLLENLGQTGFLAWYDNIPIGGISISSFNGYINEWGIARTKLDNENNLYSIDYLRWKIIEWGKENNCNYYDLSGVQMENQTAKEAGIFKNKKKWGGLLHEYMNFKN